MKVFWTVRAANDLKGIARFIADDNPAAAKRFTKSIRSRVKGLTSPDPFYAYGAWGVTSLSSRLSSASSARRRS